MVRRLRDGAQVLEPLAEGGGLPDDAVRQPQLRQPRDELLQRVHAHLARLAALAQRRAGQRGKVAQSGKV